MFLAILGIILSLAFLIVMAYRGHSVVIIAPIAALIAVLFSWDHLLASYTQIFMPAAGGFIISFFPLFLAGAVFGRLMSVSGYAEDLARVVADDLRTQARAPLHGERHLAAHRPWSERVCDCVHHRADRQTALSARKRVSEAHAGCHRSRNLHLRHRRHSRLTSAAQCDSHALLPHDDLRCPGA